MDKKTAIIGSILIILLVGSLFVYQRVQDSQDVTAQKETEEQVSRPGTINGYEEEEALVGYMLWQFQQEDWDLAMRGCAVRDVAENFNLKTCIQYTDSFEPLELLPPSNWDSPAYSAIAEMRMEGFYADWLERCMDQAGSTHEVRFYGVEEAFPEHPDGKYYEKRNIITEILGCRSLKEVKITAQIDGAWKEWYWTLVRYGKSWKVLLFTSLSAYGSEQPEIVPIEEAEKRQLISYKTEEVLPAEYGILNANGEATGEETIRKFFLYLTRQDVWSAASYMKVYEEEIPHTEKALLKKQGELGKELQAFYYRFFFRDQNRYEWYLRDLAVRAEDIIEDSRSDQIIGMDVLLIQQVEDDSDGSERYVVDYGYKSFGLQAVFTLKNENGWRITNIEWK